MTKIVFIFQGSLSKFATLREQNLSYTGRVGLIQYRVYDVRFLDFVNDDGEEGIEVQISMGRQLLSQMMSNFIPPFLISIMAFCTSFFDVSKMEESSLSTKLQRKSRGPQSAKKTVAV